ncbi:Hsp20/alpha crystallin family protein [Saccharothrix syringae]|uniref:Hsp20/alpha crystallin family protein n=1 Tax=Saccharothrix syringae TaxID=103733 RepID=A0A5Q0HEE0_SACSY|nr:Hsp20/alpha crystallin family protein [Saccharothrix syringae]QFZ24656.1 Hsp20/alpha crystallin family protein [Saccharothrix syringae]
MLMRTDPFRQWERLTQQVFGPEGTSFRPAAMPMDAYRDGDEFVVRFDVPGVRAEDIDLKVERDVLTVRAERAVETGEGVQWQVTERPRGAFSRQVFLGDAVDSERIEADYEAGVLTVRIPVARKAQPRKISVAVGRREVAEPVEAPREAVGA